MASTTKIDVNLKGPTGVPLTNTRFIIKPVRAGFWSTHVGIVEDQELLFSTDLNGYVQIELWPLPYPYVMTYSYDDESVPGHFLFYVPDVDTVVNLQDLIVTRADSNDKYADDILRQIIEAKVATLAAAADAKESETNAAASADQAEEAAEQTQADALATTNDRNQIELTNSNLLALYSQVTLAISRLQSFALTDVIQLGTSYVWADSTGVLRIGSVLPSDKDTEGTIVGTQS